MNKKFFPTVSGPGSDKLTEGRRNPDVGRRATGTALAHVRLPKTAPDSGMANPDQKANSGLVRKHLGTKSMSLVKLRKVGKETAARDAFYGE